MEREWSFKITNRNQSSHIQMSKLKFVLWPGLIRGKSTFSQHNFWNANLNLVCFYSIDSAWKSIMKLCCECVTRSLASSTHPSFCNGAEIYPHCFPPFPFCSNPPSLTISKEGECLRRFSPSWRGDWTDQSQRALVVTDTGSSPKSLFFYYIWTSNF